MADHHPSSLPPLEPKSIAVLPFTNMSNRNEDEYFSDGITDEIIHALTSIPHLKVIARSSSFAFKGKPIDIRKIGKQLGVNTILEGSIRRQGNQMRITALLINVEDGAYLWSQNFDRKIEDIFAVQDEISRLIAERIRENFGHLELEDSRAEAQTQNIDAYDWYLKGNYILQKLNPKHIYEALDCFKKAISLSSHYAEAHSAIGEVYLHLEVFGMMPAAEAYQYARTAVEKAFRANKGDMRAHKIQAFISLFHDWNWEQALASYQAAIQAGMPHQNEFISYYYIFVESQPQRAIQIARQNIDRDPLNIFSHMNVGICYYFIADFEAALKALDRALMILPDFWEAIRWRSLVLGKMERYDQAISSINQVISHIPNQKANYATKLLIQAHMGEKNEVVNQIGEIDFINPVDLAMIYAALNFPEEAISCLERGFRERAVKMVTLKNHWVWEKLRGHPSFQSLEAKMKFPTVHLSDAYSTPDTKSSPLLSEQEAKQLLKRLTQAIEEEHLYTDSNLSLRKLAAHLQITSNKLSWLINEKMGQNYNEYVNFYRLQLFKQKAQDPANNHLTLLGLALESGFNSKTVFNTFFKKKEGTTPLVWMKSLPNK